MRSPHSSHGGPPKVDTVVARVVARESEPTRIGAKLRQEREKQGVSLRELARRVGVSPSLISQIELDRVNPSVSTLWSIVTELGMTMSDVFGETQDASGQTAASHKADRVVASRETRRVINLASGVRWERLTPHNDPHVEFLHVVYPVGAQSSPEHALVTHGGREYGYVLSGTLGVQVGFEEYLLGPGASIAFDSAVPHRLWTVGDSPVHAVWVVIGRVGDPRPEVSSLRSVD
jgi:transcriptional regulator with XRE-family HTH domain